MNATLAFDIYGTLIDTHGVVDALTPYFGDQAPAFSAAWRAKQLEYSFRRGLMQSAVPFSQCTREALCFCLASFGTPLSDAQIDDLMAIYGKLPAFEDAEKALAALSPNSVCWAFSNGEQSAIDQLMAVSGLNTYLRGAVSVEPVASFKPNPAVYHHFNQQTKSEPANTFLVSGNPFDVIGAHNVGWQTIWVQRDSRQVFDAWGVSPTYTVSQLSDIIDII